MTRTCRRGDDGGAACAAPNSACVALLLCVCLMVVAACSCCLYVGLHFGLRVSARVLFRLWGFVAPVGP